MPPMTSSLPGARATKKWEAPLPKSLRRSTFRTISRARGTRELWTGRPLLYTPEDLLTVVPREAGTRLWLITMGGQRGPHSLRGEDSPSAIASRNGLEAELEFVGEDGRVQVWSLSVPGTAASPEM